MLFHTTSRNTSTKHTLFENSKDSDILGDGEQGRPPPRTTRAREADAESILELWDFRRAQERTAQRDAAATREAEREAAASAAAAACASHLISAPYFRHRFIPW